MKRLIAACLTMLLFLSCSQKRDVPDWSALTASNHPRILLDAGTFSKLKKAVEKGDNEVLMLLHQNQMHMADSCGLDPAPLTHELDASGKRILTISRSAIARILSAAYAYRFTGDKRYLEHAEWDINTVCGFPDWNPTHFLDVAEMTTAVSIGYDWLYNDLQPATRDSVVSAIRRFAFANAYGDFDFVNYREANTNWNQVCNAGMVCAALATYELDPQFCRKVVSDAVETNTRAMHAIYEPDGNYPEGPVYWNYGNMFQVLLISELEGTLGTDFGLSDIGAFCKTGLYEEYHVGNTGQLFNYSDNLPKIIPCYPLWYMAWRFDSPELLYNEVRMLREGRYLDIESDRLLPLALAYAWRIDPARIQAPKERLLVGGGANPEAIARTGWGKDDLYLAMKGGSASVNHGHMDVGGIVFDAYGVRWIQDPPRMIYVRVELPIRRLGGDFWNMKQNSLRWQLFTYNNRQHSTLTINDRDHNVNGYARVVDSFDSPDRVGASLDLTDTFFDDLKSAVRTAAIRDDSWLEITDSLATRDDAPAHVRWTIVSEGEPEMVPDGIILRKNGVAMKLSMEGAPATWRTWSNDPMDYDIPTRDFDVRLEGSYICGYELDIPAGTSLKLISSIKRI